MSGLTASILEDYDHDAIEPMTEDELNTTALEVDELEQRIGQLFSVSRSIGNFGLTPTAKLLLGTTGLISANDVGLESSDSLVDLDQELALETLNQKIKETAAKWAGKIMQIAKSGADAILSALSPIYTAVAAKVKTVVAKAGDLVMGGVAYAKAHPYKTILAALGAVAATVAIVSFVGSGLPALGATNAAMKSFMTKLGTMFRGVRMPYGKITTRVVMNGEVIMAEVIPAESMVVGSSSIGALGWTKSAITAVSHQLGSVWTALSTSVRVLSGRVVSTARKIFTSPLLSPSGLGETVTRKTGAPLAGWMSQQILASQYMRLLFKIIPNIFSLVSAVFRQMLQLVKSTFTGLSHPTAQAA